MFKNGKYTTITDYQVFYIDSTTSFNQLYDVINLTIETGEKKELELELKNNEKILLKFESRKVCFWYWNGSSWSYSMYLNLKNINKLFGKV